MSKSKKPSKEPRVITPPVTRSIVFNKYSPEVLASTAVHLLEGDNYYEAADRALRLLEACQQRLVRNEMDCQGMRDKVKQMNELEETHQIKEDFVPYGQAVKIITGQTRPERAREYFERLLGLHLKYHLKDRYTPQELTKSLKAHEEGLSRDAVLHYKKEYEMRRATGELEMKVPPKKAKGSPRKKTLGAGQKAEK